MSKATVSLKRNGVFQDRGLLHEQRSASRVITFPSACMLSCPVCTPPFLCFVVRGFVVSCTARTNRAEQLPERSVVSVLDSVRDETILNPAILPKQQAVKRVTRLDFFRSFLTSDCPACTGFRPHVAPFPTLSLFSQCSAPFVPSSISDFFLIFFVVFLLRTYMYTPCVT